MGASILQSAGEIIARAIQPEKYTAVGIPAYSTVIGDVLVEELHRSIAHDKLSPVGMVRAIMPGILPIGPIPAIVKINIKR